MKAITKHCVSHAITTKLREMVADECAGVGRVKSLRLFV